MLIACTDLDFADGLLGIAALAADLPETTKLWNTINDWWDEIEVFTTPGSPMPRPRTPRTSRSSGPAGAISTTSTTKPASSWASAHRHGRRSPLTQRATTVNCR